MGRIIAHRTKAISPSHLEGISKVPKPQTARQIMFLGIADYGLCCEKGSIESPDSKKEGGKALSAQLKWTTDASIAFESIKKEMQSAPALAIPNYTKEFHLYLANRYEAYPTAVLM